MSLYEMSAKEQEYLAQYDITKFERPSVATDIAIFSIMEEGEHDNYRKLPTKALKLLLIKRATYPYKDLWALPGGFCRPDEDVQETALRELYEETGLTATLDTSRCASIGYPISSFSRKEVVFYLGKVAGIPKVREGEIDKYKWVTAEELKDYLFPDTFAACKELLRQV